MSVRTGQKSPLAGAGANPKEIMRSIDLNADLGEGCAFDQALMPLISSANISCGAHAGSEQQIRAAVDRALQFGVVIGAHPSYPDRQNRGRKTLPLSPEQLQDSLVQQLTWLQDLVRAEGGKLNHVKPHGALYNDAATDPELARQIASIVQQFDNSLTLVGLAGSELIRAGSRAGLAVLAEAFVDRRYCPDGTLVPRALPGAIIKDAQEATQQALGIIQNGKVVGIDGSVVHVSAQTLCIHGDTPGALTFAKALRGALASDNIDVRAPARPFRPGE